MKRRNKFSLSHFKLFTGKMGYLYPISCVETLPGDTFQMSTSLFIRFSPMVAPVMTPVVAKIHHYFVPMRLLWDNFEDFITGGPDGMSVPPIPCINNFSQAAVDDNPLFDLLGYRGSFNNGAATIPQNALPLRAYALIYNEWYRDQNLQDPININYGNTYDEPDNPGNLAIMRAPWDKDYFTTATPWEQKGAAINVPVNGTPSGTLSISSSGVAPTFTNGTFTGSLYGSTTKSSGTGDNTVDASTSLGWSVSQDANSAGPLAFAETGLVGSFTGSSTLGNININQFREAMALQRFEEHRALYGSRYVEYLRYLGVKASDGRLQRPEYLGGGRSVIQFSEVLQTAQDGDTPVGTMRGHGIGAMRTNRFRRFFEEHGYVMTMLSVRPKSIYTQGIPRRLLRQIKTDFWQKELEHIGQQEVYNAELYSESPEPLGVFGYSDRYNEYRTEWSSVHGEFRNLLNYWHLGREFASPPVLNGDFISSLPSDRIFADQTGNDTLYFMVNNSIQARRLVSKRGNPI